MKKYSFTLSEVLVTIGIIGIVAAMTLPSIVGKYQKKSTVTKLKRTYSLLLQGIEQAERVYGETKYWDYSLSGYDFLQRYIKPYYTVLKEYDVGELKYEVFNIKKAKVPEYFDYFILPRIVLNDGVMLSVEKQSKVFVVVVDLNADKLPNQYGKDLFAFSVQLDGRILPYGVGNYLDAVGSYDRDFLMKGDDWRACQESGVFCAGVIMMDNWEMKKDYPW